ncbi:DUF1382 family protein [Pseudomonas sp. 39004]|uniref:DUF1382 family protein n=1 Tax=Pseudomonas sp. 39004 TaxID=2967213 RepID=UPI0023641FFC|nr:DUF1382 family protein [Pseudomonas sp. 39004]MDD1958984.1 DUF1382 family protein [Pseudomonas sp. 39004]
MMRATPVSMRRALEAARTYAEHGILFVPMPVFNEADQSDLVRQVDERLERMAAMAEAEEKH